MNVSIKKNLQELLENELGSDFELNYVASTEDFHWFHFRLKCGLYDKEFPMEIQKANATFRNYFASLSQNYIVSTNIRYNSIQQFDFFDINTHCNDAYELFKRLIEQTATSMYDSYFNIQTDLMFFGFDENFLNKIRLIVDNFDAMYQVINSHNQFTASISRMYSGLEISICDLKYFFRAQKFRLPMTGQFEILNKTFDEVLYKISLLQEKSVFISELLSILSKEKDENDLKLIFTKESNKLKRLSLYLLNFKFKQDTFLADILDKHILMSEDIVNYELMEEYFQNDYELINRVAHERLSEVFEENGETQLRLDHPFIQFEQHEKPIMVSQLITVSDGKKKIPTMTSSATIRLDFSLPSKEKKLKLITHIPEVLYTHNYRILEFELVSQ